MTTGEPGYFDLRRRRRWDDENLYISFSIEEPFPEAYQTERDSIVFVENDVEVFIDGGDCYYEFEINAAARSTRCSSSGTTRTRTAAGSRCPSSTCLERKGLTFGGTDRQGPHLLARDAPARAALGLPSTGTSPASRPRCTWTAC